MNNNKTADIIDINVKRKQFESHVELLDGLRDAMFTLSAQDNGINPTIRLDIVVAIVLHNEQAIINSTNGKQFLMTISTNISDRITNYISNTDDTDEIYNLMVTILKKCAVVQHDYRL